MFRNHEPNLTSALLAAPALALLMAGGAALPSKPSLPYAPAPRAAVQISAAGGMDVAFIPVGHATQSAPLGQTAFLLEPNPASVMDLGFSPVDAGATPEPIATQAAPMEIVSFGPMDLSFTPAER